MFRARSFSGRATCCRSFSFSTSAADFFAKAHIQHVLAVIAVNIERLRTAIGRANPRSPRADQDMSLVTFHAAPGSASEESMPLLGSWGSTPTPGR
ncbi:hypothetical protein ACIQM0_28695 [Streptomyces sp. NPDC091387]|uniref:hypothetical protein n=1 Tax=Streptomyces sp. NPDC091387 TaxID=3365998 RepID=UPI003810E6CD